MSTKDKSKSKSRSLISRIMSLAPRFCLVFLYLDERYRKKLMIPNAASEAVEVLLILISFFLIQENIGVFIGEKYIKFFVIHLLCLIPLFN